MTPHVMPIGWKCIRNWPHGGPCALVPRWWNLKAQWNYWLGGK